MDYTTISPGTPEWLAMHCIGMDRRKPYKRHGRLFYRPYRNYYHAPRNTSSDAAWMELVAKGYAEQSDRSALSKKFWLTRSGLDWLGERLGMTIYDEED